MLSHDIFICNNPGAVVIRSELDGMFCIDLQDVLYIYIYIYLILTSYIMFDKEKGLVLLQAKGLLKISIIVCWTFVTSNAFQYP